MQCGTIFISSEISIICVFIPFGFSITNNSGLELEIMFGGQEETCMSYWSFDLLYNYIIDYDMICSNIIIWALKIIFCFKISHKVFLKTPSFTSSAVVLTCWQENQSFSLPELCSE